ncbi:hypothetical protein AM228_14310, partial [Planktothricoides sp. SR001]|uniref:hypothetical protein n=2 Tax=Planktothricoides TaxID=132607 RepID=UPI0006C3DF8A
GKIVNFYPRMLRPNICRLIPKFSARFTHCRGKAFAPKFLGKIVNFYPRMLRPNICRLIPKFYLWVTGRSIRVDKLSVFPGYF